MLHSLNYVDVDCSDAPEAVRHGTLEVVQPGLEAYQNNSSNSSHDIVAKAAAKTSPVYFQDASASARDRRRICCLRPVTFTLACLVVILLMLLAAAGGSFGSVAQQNLHELSAARSTISELCSATAGGPAATKTGSNGIATVTVTTTSRPTPSSDCLQKANQNYTSTDSGLSYTMLCGTVYSGGDPAVSYYGAVMEFLGIA